MIRISKCDIREIPIANASIKTVRNGPDVVLNCCGLTNVSVDFSVLSEMLLCSCKEWLFKSSILKQITLVILVL